MCARSWGRRVATCFCLSLPPSPSSSCSGMQRENAHSLACAPSCFGNLFLLGAEGALGSNHRLWPAARMLTLWRCPWAFERTARGKGNGEWLLFFVIFCFPPRGPRSIDGIWPLSGYPVLGGVPGGARRFAISAGKGRFSTVLYSCLSTFPGEVSEGTDIETQFIYNTNKCDLR